MRTRAQSRDTATGRLITCSLDLVCLAVRGRDVVVLLLRGDRSWRLPGVAWRGRPVLEDAVAALMRESLGREPAWHEQVAAFDARQRPARPGLSVVFAALSAGDGEVPAGSEWHSAARLPGGLSRHDTMAVRAALAHVRNRMDRVPLVFRLVGPSFTLGDLQRVYEVLLGRRLHKASFRRALQAASLVAATDDWRRDGRGRPARLYRYAPADRRGQRRALRFEMADA